MAEYTTAEWIMLSEIFRGDEEKCHQLLHDFPEDYILSLDWNLLAEERRITQSQLKRFRTFDFKVAENYGRDCHRKEIKVITPDSKEYPHQLEAYMHPPIVLYAVGNTGLLAESNTLTVVGTRSANEYGQKTAYLLSREVAAKGIVIISGCAVGIDAAAHRGALDANGKTIAVLGCGMDVNYPAENYRLRKEITAKGGLQITEYPPGTRALGSFFPHRNRLLAGLSRAVLVAQAPYKSGSLITAEYAVEQGKELFCVPPYSIWNPDCSGVTRYLRDGATPVFSPADILLHYFTLEPSLLNSEKFLQAALDYSDAKPGKLTGKPKTAPAAVKAEQIEEHSQEDTAKAESEKQQDSAYRSLPPQFTDERFRTVFAQLSEKPRVLDELIGACKLSVPDLIEILSELEVVGLVENHSGGRYSVKFEPKM